MYIIFLLAIFAVISGLYQIVMAPRIKTNVTDNDLNNELRRIREERLRGSYYDESEDEESEDEGRMEIPYVIRIPNLGKENPVSELKQELRYTLGKNYNQSAKSVSDNQAKPDAYALRIDEKPYKPHSTDDCTGGSIHDGYHEGTARKPAEASGREGVIGNQGRALKTKNTKKTKAEVRPQGVSAPGEDHSVHFTPQEATDKANPASTGADKLVRRIAKKPSIVQGVIWGEILGKPKSEIG